MGWLETYLTRRFGNWSGHLTAPAPPRCSDPLEPVAVPASQLHITGNGYRGYSPPLVPPSAPQAAWPTMLDDLATFAERYRESVAS